MRLIEILDSYPLRGRKSRDYAIWSAAVRWWVGPDPTITEVGRDWEPMVYLKQRLQDAKRFDASNPPLYDDGHRLKPDWAGFLAGFVTAEGCLGIHRNERRLFPSLQIRVRRDDLPLLEQLRLRTELGRIYPERRLVAGRSPAATWLVRTRDDLPRLTAILDAHPLQGRKAREYQVWREAVEVFTGDEPRQRVQARLVGLRESLVAARRYDGSAG